MSKLTMVKHEPFGIHDTGPPSSGGNYTTLMIVHGYAWQSGVFARLLPFAEKHNARIVLVNRRGYPGSSPYNSEELQQMITFIMESPKSRPTLEEFMKQRAREFYNFLEAFIKSEKIPQEGGITISGWSLGSLWVLSLLAFAPLFPVGEVPLTAYIRSLTAYDSPAVVAGYAPPPNGFNPLFHPSLSPEERIKVFPSWVSGYYVHGESPAELELRNALSDPPPTIMTMSQEDVDACLYPSPGDLDGCDAILVMFGVKYGMFEQIRKAAIFPTSQVQTSDDPSKNLKKGWESVKLRWVWCDRSIWETPFAYWSLKDEIQEASKIGKQAREIEFVRIRGANHYIHWEEPELALSALLGEGNEFEAKSARL